MKKKTKKRDFKNEEKGIDGSERGGEKGGAKKVVVLGARRKRGWRSRGQERIMARKEEGGPMEKKEKEWGLATQKEGP